MSHSACLVSLWGGTSNGHVVVKHLRSFEAKKKQFRPQVQPLQITAHETALLAGHCPEEDDQACAKQALIRLSSFPCIATTVRGEDDGSNKNKKRKTVTDEQQQACLCDKCIASGLGYDDFHHSGAFEAQFDMVKELHLTFPTSRELEKLQAEFFEALLGKELAKHVKLRFGTLEKEDEYDPYSETFLYFKDKIEIYEPEGQYHGSLVVLDVQDDTSPPTALERWAFFKAVTLLGLDTKPFPCSNAPKKLVSFLAQPASAFW